MEADRAEVEHKYEQEVRGKRGEEEGRGSGGAVHEGARGPGRMVSVRG